jgi:tetratricopeptide (TPR) repeat protein
MLVHFNCSDLNQRESLSAVAILLSGDVFLRLRRYTSDMSSKNSKEMRCSAMSLSGETITERYTIALQALSEIAEAYYFQGSLDDALHLWQAGEQLLAGKEVQPADQVKFLLSYGSFLAYHYFLTNRKEELMQTVVRRARQGAEAIQDKFAIATALFLLGQTLYYHNLLVGESDYTQARDYFQRASALREKIGDAYNLAESLFYTGLTYDRNGQKEQAEKYYRRALPMALEQGNKWAASEAHRHLTDHTEGEQRLRHALCSLELREEMGFKRGLPPAQLLISDIYIEQGELARALEYCQQAEQLSEGMGLQIYLMDALLTRGEIAYKQGKRSETREYFERASVLAQKLNNAHGIASVNEKLEMLARVKP